VIDAGDFITNRKIHHAPKSWTFAGRPLDSVFSRRGYVKASAARRASYSIGLTATSAFSFATLASAQVPQGAATAAEVTGSIGTSEPIVLQTQSPPMSRPNPPQADEGGAADYLHRYAPQEGLVEIGLFIGPLFISDENSFRGPTVVSPGLPPSVKPLSTFEQPALEIGLRGGYYPFSFLGGELEGMVAVAESHTGQAVTVLAARAQAVAQLPYWSVVPFATAGIGYWAVRNDVSGNDADPAFHYGAGAKVNVTHDLAVRVDVRDSITNQRGTGDYPHNIEALAGANLVFGRTPEGSRDSDRDNVVDDRDQCPFEAGTLPNGCPLRDSDSDGIMDPSDQCVMEVGIAPTGCPVRDADQDGVVDGDDQCIREKGESPTGCPDGDQDGFLDRADRCPAIAGAAPDGCVQDTDGDGFLGADDHCPNEAEIKNGFEDSDGCPDELPQAVENFMGVIAGIEFDTGKAEIRPSSAIALEKALNVLTEYPSLRVEITGHTDNTGAREKNLDLSQQRADSVKEYLIGRGIQPSRIQSKGAGPDVPLTTNDTLAGRQKNRRIEFRVIE
jgi:outer membrane protein OmpA-like peptidoglycan-associated protein